jgi:hypothetical protein
MGRARNLELARRQQQLLVRSAELRVTLGQQARVLESPLALADQARAGLQWLRNHPLWSLLSLALIAVTRPRRALRWTSRLWWGWNLYRKARRWMSRATEPAPGASQSATAGSTDRS